MDRPLKLMPPKVLTAAHSKRHGFRNWVCSSLLHTGEMYVPNDAFFCKFEMKWMSGCGGHWNCSMYPQWEMVCVGAQRQKRCAIFPSSSHGRGRRRGFSEIFHSRHGRIRKFQEVFRKAFRMDNKFGRSAKRIYCVVWSTP